MTGVRIKSSYDDVEVFCYNALPESRVGAIVFGLASMRKME
jgi:hypothetical protein